jgi:hypothetical protein
VIEDQHIEAEEYRELDDIAKRGVVGVADVLVLPPANRHLSLDRDRSATEHQQQPLVAVLVEIPALPSRAPGAEPDL